MANAQIALEFIIIFSLIVIIFLLFFGLIITQRASVLNQQGFSQLQLIAQDIAQQINLASSAGSGYYSNTSLYSSIGLPISGINISSSGLVTVTATLGTQNSMALAYSKSRGILPNGYLSANFIAVQNYLGSICVDFQCLNLTDQVSSVQLSSTPAAAGATSGYLLQAKAIGATGNTVANVLIGFQATLGNFTSAGGTRWFVNYTNANGIASAFIYQAGPSGLSRVTATAFYQANGIANNLTGWWPLNLGAGSHAYDISNGNNLGVMSNASYAAPAFAAKFNQDSYMATRPEASSATTLTIGAWVYPTSYTANQALVGQGDAGTGSWELFQNGTKYTFRIYGVGTVSFGSVYVNRWSHVAVTYSSGTTNAFINGAPSGNFILGSTLLANRPLYIGYSNNDITSSYFSGMVSNLQVYNTVLSQNSISDLYALGVSSPPVGGSTLLGWWPLEGSGKDYSQNANNAVPYGSVAFANPNLNASAAVNASSGYAASFSGTGSYASLGNSITLSPEAGADGNMTLCTWYNVTSLTGYYGPLLKGESAPSNGNAWEYTLDQGGSAQGFTVWTPAGGDIASYYTGSQPNADKWYFACFTYNYAAQKSYYYLNGVQYTASITSGNGPASAGTGNLVIGSGENGNSNVILADLQIYNNSLSQSQILQLYNEGQQGFPIQNSHLVGWWPLEGSANDSAASQIASTSTNAAYKQYQFSRKDTVQYSLSGYGANLNGAGNILIPNNVIVGSNTLSLLAWLRPSQYINGVEGIAGFNGASSGFYMNATKGAYGTANVVFGVDIGGSWKIATAANAFPNPDAWYGVAGVYNGSDVNIYVGGSLHGSVPASGAITLPDNAITLGGTSGHYFNGTIADVQVYKTALNSNQISLLYNVGMPASASLNIPIWST